VNNILVVDIGGTNVKFGFSLDGVPHSEVRLFPSDALRRDPVVSLAAMARTFLAETKLVPDTIVSTVPGFVDTDGDRIIFAANLPQLNNLRLASEWAKLMGIPVVLERDAVLSLVGEHLAGAARGADTVLGLFFGTGVGAAFLERGRPFRGAGWALEVGHMPFKGQRAKVDASRSECLEVYVSGRVLQTIANLHHTPIESLFAMRSHNQALAQDLDVFVHDQASAVAVAVAMFSPQVLLIGGGVCEMSGFPREQLAGLIETSFPFAHTGRAMDLRWATLGWRSVLHGAPHAVKERRLG
jgi:predicted NBD/HSP70 family sugar kinase